MKYPLINSIAPAALALLLLLAGCHTGSRHESTSLNTMDAVRISSEDAEASGAYITYDNQQSPVLCWTEKINDHDGHIVKYAHFDTLSQRLGEPVTVTASKGTRAHDESMNKVGFKGDGTAIVLFAKKHPTSENRFAGSILYTMSGDLGKTWTAAKYLHSDTAKTYGRSFFDMATLPDGEIAAIWLDGRYRKETTGSALFFTKTAEGSGFNQDYQIGESTCECCRTDIYVDEKNNIHVAYRDILFPPALMGQQVRDMVHSISYDGGKSFSPAKRISEDNWAIEGCPHTGPSLALNQNGLHVTWFTAGGDPGVYFASSKDNGGTFSDREKISSVARHPQIISLPDGTLVMVWDESPEKSNEQKPVHASTHSLHESHDSSSGSRIMLQIKNVDGSVEQWAITDGRADASHPVVISSGGGNVLIAWTETIDNKSAIFYKVIDIR